MFLARRWCVWGPALVILFALTLPVASAAQVSPGKEAPTGGAPEGSPRSRLTLSGSFEVDAYSQKDFFLGARRGAAKRGEFDAFWTQRLTLRPRVILSNDVNVTLKLDVAQGVWGLDGGAAPGATTDLTRKRKAFLDLRVDRAYLSFRHRGTGTRWYLGRQQFALGNLVVLDEEAPGLQAWRDFGSRAAFGVGFAKESESGSIADYQDSTGAPGARQVRDSRDADLLVAEARLGKDGGGLFLNPFFASYLDRSNADGATLLPDGHELQARFRPSITRATVIGLVASRAGKSLRADAEVDWLKGVDRVKNADSGLDQAHDVNNGNLKGMNVYGRLSWTGSRLELAGTGARGSGDPDPFRNEGNINSLYSQGHWFLTEVWGNGLSLEDVGLAPQGLANPDARGYRGLENTTAFQVAAAVKLRASLKVGVSWTMLRCTQAIKPWWDQDGDGVISAHNASALNEYGLDRYAKGPAYRGGQSTELGSEIDGRLDWTPSDRVTVTLRGGKFSPGPAAGFLINGTGKFAESPLGLRLNVTVPIPEFSLGG
jgi:hypothetical protein